MADRIKLEIVTPERQFLQHDVDEVTVPGLGGEFGVLPGHTPLVSQLAVAGLVAYRDGGKQELAFVSQGFVEVMPDRVTILAERAELPEEIDLEKAREELKAAELALKDAETKSEPESLALALAGLDGAMVRVQVAERNNRR